MMVDLVDPSFRVPFHCRQLAPSNISGWDYSSVPELSVCVPSLQSKQYLYSASLPLPDMHHLT